MIATALAISLIVFAAFTILVGFAMLWKIWNINPDEFAEIGRIQGGLKNLLTGTLEHNPIEYGDFRIVRGLRWDRKNKRYIAQSAVSSEGFRAAFPK